MPLTACHQATSQGQGHALELLELLHHVRQLIMGLPNLLLELGMLLGILGILASFLGTVAGRWGQRLQPRSGLVEC